MINNSGTYYYINSLPKIDLMKQFNMKALGDIKSILGANIKRESNGNITVNQSYYVKSLINKFNININKVKSDTPTPDTFNKIIDEIPEDSKHVNNTTYRQIIGSLLYMVTVSRPDLAFSVNTLAQLAKPPKEKHLELAKSVLEYACKSNKDVCVHYITSNSHQEMNTIPIDVEAYADALFAPEVSKRKSITGNIIYMNNAPISWISKRQSLLQYTAH